MTHPHGTQSVRIVDVEMSFGNMVVFIIKWSLASIPAALILGFFGFTVFVVFSRAASRFAGG